PMHDGEVSDDTRLRAAVPTIEKLRAGGAKVILLAHFDRPKGKVVPAMSLEPIAPALAKVLGAPVAFGPDCVGPAAASAIAATKDGGVLLLENVRFHPGEEKNDPAFAQALAANGDLYVHDAFSAAHRAHASTEGL
ncbi:MAG TPA: phosphoglycerate kinase, partial [Phenylobacterium sp.]|nr:phosphoglycerate kinase [Phenylobacterium sp.]